MEVLKTLPKELLMNLHATSFMWLAECVYFVSLDAFIS